MKRTTLFAILLLLPIFAAAQQKTPEPPAVKIPFEKSLQAIVVTTKDWTAASGTARLIARKDMRSNWKTVGDSFPVALGSSGMNWGDKDLMPLDGVVKYKKEGDNSSPAGFFPITAAFGSATKPESLELPYTKIDQHTVCVTDPRSHFYNRIANRMHVGNLDWKTSQTLTGDAYALGLFVAYNSYPPERDRGSCVFLHVWKDASTATAGSTAMERRNMERVAAWVAKDKNPYLIQMPLAEYDRHRKTWSLPKIK